MSFISTSLCVLLAIYLVTWAAMTLYDRFKR